MIFAWWVVEDTIFNDPAKGASRILKFDERSGVSHTMRSKARSKPNVRTYERAHRSRRVLLFYYCYYYRFRGDTADANISHAHLYPLRHTCTLFQLYAIFDNTWCHTANAIQHWSETVAVLVLVVCVPCSETICNRKQVVRIRHGVTTSVDFRNAKYLAENNVFSVSFYDTHIRKRSLYDDGNQKLNSFKKK